MKQFASILFCPLSEGDNAAAFRQTADLATGNDATITLFGVVPEAPRRHGFFGRGGSFDAAAASVDEQQQRLEGLADNYRERSINIVVGSGNAAIATVQQVLAAGHDLVVVTTDRDRKDSADINRLLRKCPCPVWVAGVHTAPIRRVLAAVNPVPEEADLNRLILEVASSMVEADGGELHVVHAWELFGEHLIRRHGAFTEAELEAEREHEKQQRLQDLHSVLDAWDGSVEPTVHLEHGRPSQIVVDLVEDQDIDLLVLGTVARSGIPGLLMGNTAERILDQVRCSTITVKPPGFVSPLATD